MKNALNPLAAALSVGILWALCLFGWTFLSMQWGYGQGGLEMMNGMYPGYAQTVTGAFIGLIWGFLDGFISAYIVVFVYNFFARKLGK